MKINRLSPDIYEIEDFVTKTQQSTILEYCSTLDEEQWWQSEDEEYKNGFFYGKQKLGELPDVFNEISQSVQNLFSESLYCAPLSLQRHPEGNSMEVHEDYWLKDLDYYIRYGIVVYYNDDYVGGEISYPSLGFSHKPKARSLVMHGGNIPHGTTPVIGDSYRYFSTSFIRGSVDKPVILNQKLFRDIEQSDGSAYP
jgi:hypothetical protein